jgi:hypothetical protein
MDREEIIDILQQISTLLRKTPELCLSVRHAYKQSRLNQTDESFEK